MSVPETTSASSRPRRMALVALSCVGFLWAGGGAEAAPRDLETELPRQAYRLIKELQGRGCQNVGVLRFRIHTGDKEENFQAGHLGAVIARSLENALILMNDKEAPLGIIRQPGEVIAGKKERLTYLTPEGREKLFGYKYPLAWGEDEVKASAFVTGFVQMNPKERTVGVAIEILDRKDRKPEVFSTFSVRIDRTILTDLCQGFVLDPSKIGKAGVQEEDEAAEQFAALRGEPGKPIGTELAVVDFEIHYGKAKQTVSPHPRRSGAYQVAEPAAGEKGIVFVVKNRADRKVGVVLAVNGLNTLYEEDVHQTRPELCSRWILGPGKELEVKGFYRRGDSDYGPFQPLTEEESMTEEALNPHPRLGAIEMWVLVEGGDAKERRVERAGLRRLAASPKPALSAREAAALVQKATGGKVEAAGFIIPGRETLPTRLTEDKLNNPSLQENRVIWYRSRGAGGL